jgi:hypothetical protein
MNRSTRAAQLLLDGEATALSRTVAPRRDRSVELALAPINSAADILGAIKAVADAGPGGAASPLPKASRCRR